MILLVVVRQSVAELPDLLEVLEEFVASHIVGLGQFGQTAAPEHLELLAKGDVEER